MSSRFCFPIWRNPYEKRGQKKAYQWALTAPYPEAKLQALAHLYPYLESSKQADVLQTAVQTTVSTNRLVESLRPLIPYVPKDDRQPYVTRLFEMATAPDWNTERTDQIARLYPYLNDEQRRQAFEIILQTPPYTGSSLPHAVAPLLPMMDTMQQRRVVDASYIFADRSGSIFCLLPLLQTLPADMAKEVTEKLLDAALQIHDQEHDVEAVAALPFVSPEDAARLSRWVFEHRNITTYSSSPSLNTRLIRDIAPYLPLALVETTYRETMEIHQALRG